MEVEVNGLMTYNRAMVKMDAAKAAELNRSVIATPLEAATGAAPVK